MLLFELDRESINLWIMRIRPHTSSDYLAIAELRWLLKTDAGRMLPDRCKHEFIDRYQKHLEESDRDGRTVHWLIDDDGVIAGVMTVRIIQKEPSPGKESGSWGYLTNSFVIPEKRNRGLGTQLLESIRSWAIDLGLELLIVWPSEASYPFYRRAGFRGRDDPLELVLDADEG